MSGNNESIGKDLSVNGARTPQGAAHAEGNGLAYFSGSNMPGPFQQQGSSSPYDVLQELLQPRGPSLKDFFTLLKKQRRVVVLTALTVFLFGVTYCSLMPDEYTAISTVEIRGYSPVLGQAGVETLLQNDTRKISYPTTTIAKLTHLGLADEVLNTDGLGNEIHSYFKNKSSLTKRRINSVLRWFGLGGRETHLDEQDPRYVHKQSFINKYLKLLQISPIHETSLVQIRATTTSPKLSQKIANAHAEGLIRHLTREQRESLGAHLETLRAHADELRKKLKRAEDEVAQYATDHQLVGFGEDAQSTLMLSHLTELSKLVSTAQAQRSLSEGKMGGVPGANADGISLIDDETVKDLRTKLKDAEAEYAALSQLVTGEYPKLLELKGKVDSLRGTIKRERQGNVAALRAQYESSLISEKLLTKQFEDQLNKAQAVSGQLVQYNLLQREAASLRDLTQSVLKSLNETEISSSNNDSNVSISDFAPFPRSPSAPRRNIIIMFSLMLGIIAGVILAVLQEVMDSSIKVSDDAQNALALPTLGIIPSFKAIGAHNLIAKEVTTWDKIYDLFKSGSLIDYYVLGGFLAQKKKGKFELRNFRFRKDPKVAKEAPVVVQPEPVMPNRPPGALALPEAGVLDALRTLRANILFSSTQNSSRVIMAASAREREGKTSVVCNLAVTFARASQRTLLIDGDLRRPKVALRFSLDENQPGLVDYLAGQVSLESIISPAPVANLSVITAGSPTVNPTELLGSEKMRDLIARLREHYDVILIDSAPVLPVADSLMIAQFAESVIFVVRSGRTERTVAQEAVRRLRRIGAKVRGVVLNDFDPGVGNYSSDRYSVSRYKSLAEQEGRIYPQESGYEGNPDEANRAAG